MKHLTAIAFFFVASCAQHPCYAQITILSSPQSVALKSPTPITCTDRAVAVVCTAPPPTITLPVEVFGPDGTIVTSSFQLATPAAAQLWLQVHGLRYDTEASVQVNNSVWLPLSNAGVTLLGNAQTFGGIGGGFSTIQMLVNLPASVLIAGTNTIKFRFNATDGISSGFRVLAFNLQLNGVNQLPASLFVYDDPATWKPPLSNPADIAAGKTLWSSAALADPAGGALVPIKAHCSDCHAVDGRDLKYFNYSNLSIEQRATFHGLTALQGQQIASYIRSLTTPAPGRPWNPPYQPGPGMDSQPVANWAAGAGITAVLPNDQAMQNYIMPNGSTAGWAPTAYLNTRETPIVMQLPDWNSWLPTVHPMDGFGATFTGSTFNTLLPPIGAALAAKPGPAGYTAAQQLFQNWFQGGSKFEVAKEALLPTTWTPALMNQFDSPGRWAMVKMWELNQTYGLESMPSAIFGAKASARGWLGATAFGAASNIQHVPSPSVFSLEWYHVQLVLNDGQGQQVDHNPQDYGYDYGFIYNTFARDAKVPGLMIELEYMIKALQEFTLTGRPPTTPEGFHPRDTSPFSLVNFISAPTLQSGYAPATVTAIATAFTQFYLAKASSYTPQQYYQSGLVSPTDNPADNSKFLWSGTFQGQAWYMAPRLRFIGVDGALVDKLIDWYASIWPAANWALVRSATCTSLQTCTSGY